MKKKCEDCQYWENQGGKIGICHNPPYQNMETMAMSSRSYCYKHRSSETSPCRYCAIQGEWELIEKHYNTLFYRVINELLTAEHDRMKAKGECKGG